MKSIEEFSEAFTALLLGPEKYQQYISLRSSIGQEQTKSYQDRKSRLEEMHRRGAKLAGKISTYEACPDDFQAQRELQAEIEKVQLNPIQLDKIVAEHLIILDKVNIESRIALSVREAYRGYNPDGRTFCLIDGQPYTRGNSVHPAREFKYLSEIVQADGGKVDNLENAQDILFRSHEICDNDSNMASNPLNNAQDDKGWGLIFVTIYPLQQHCSGDWELKKAWELQQRGKNIAVIAGHNNFQAVRYV